MFDIICAHCGSDMVLRHSTICINQKWLGDESVNVMAYKCPTCAWFVRFMIYWDAEYLKGILKNFRCGEGFFVPVKDFQNHEIIKERLAALGYW